MYQAKRLAKKVAFQLDFHKGDNVVLKDVSNKTPLMRFCIICSADNSRKVNGLKNEAVDAIEKGKGSIHHIEAKSEDWVVVDAYDIVIHIFSTQARVRYNLDGIYKDCENVDYSVLYKKIIKGDKK